MQKQGFQHTQTVRTKKILVMGDFKKIHPPAPHKGKSVLFVEQPASTQPSNDLSRPQQKFSTGRTRVSAGRLVLFFSFDFWSGTAPPSSGRQHRDRGRLSLHHQHRQNKLAFTSVHLDRGTVKTSRQDQSAIGCGAIFWVRF